jgi:eukaryotic-like serine/threonine-protein kinase
VPTHPHGAEPTTVTPRVPPADTTRVGTRIAATPTPVAMPRRRKSAWPFALALGLLLAALLILFLLLNNELSDDGDGGGSIVLEDLVGLTVDQATAILEADDLKPVINLVENDEVDKDLVFEQEPPADTRVEPGEEVKLLVSAGKGQVAVPDVTGDAQEDAQQELADAGFDTFVRNEASDSVAAGSVVRTDPAAGTAATRGSRIEIFVSSGVEMVAVPDVNGKTAVSAASDLTRAGFTPVEVTEPSDEVAEGTVIRTEPGAGTQAARGSEVQLVISSGEADVVVPDVEGERENVAKARLEAAGFVVEIERIFDPPNAGEVIVQTPAGGSRAPKGSAVKITVGALASTTTTSGGNGGGGGTTTTTDCERDIFGNCR